MSLPLNSLEKITSLKNRLTQQAKWTYGAALTDQKQAELRLSELNESLNESNFELAKSIEKTTLNVQEMMEWHLFQSVLQIKTVLQTQEVNHRTSQLQHEQEKLTQRYQEEKIWDKLRSRKLIEIQTESAKTQQLLLDELTINRFGKV